MWADSKLLHFAYLLLHEAIIEFIEATRNKLNWNKKIGVLDLKNAYSYFNFMILHHLK